MIATFRIRRHPGRAHIIYDEHGCPAIMLQLPNGKYTRPGTRAARKYPHMNRMVRQAQRKLNALRKDKTPYAFYAQRHQRQSNRKHGQGSQPLRPG